MKTHQLLTTTAECEDKKLKTAFKDCFRYAINFDVNSMKIMFMLSEQNGIIVCEMISI